jgi:lipoate-protein ligase A
MSRKVTYVTDDDLIEATRRDGEARMRISRPPGPMVVLGRGSKAEVELDLDACERDQIPVFRRRGGGCAVVLDPGNVIVSVVHPIAGIGGNQAHFDRISRWLIGGLDRIGFPGIRQEGISDLVLDDRKIAGSSLYRPRGLLYYSASLLVRPDLKLIERYLAHPPREPEYRRGRPHAEFVRALVAGSSSLSAEDVEGDLRETLHVGDLALE